jgi:hypothetical protein
MVHRNSADRSYIFIEWLLACIKQSTMNQHPSGIEVEIVGINHNSNARSCKEHNTCGTAVVKLDTVLRL